MLAKAKLASSITFIVLASFTSVTYDRQNMFIIQATGHNLMASIYVLVQLLWLRLELNLDYSSVKFFCQVPSITFNYNMTKLANTWKVRSLKVFCLMSVTHEEKVLRHGQQDSEERERWIRALEDTVLRHKLARKKHSRFEKSLKLCWRERIIRSKRVRFLA
jgi:hypothetical protein